MGDLRLIHFDDTGELLRSSLDVEFSFGSPENGSKTIRRILSDVRFLGARTYADRKLMQVAHGGHAINADFVPLEWCGALIREHMSACLAAILLQTVLESSVLPAIRAAAAGAAKASSPALRSKFLCCMCR